MSKVAIGITEIGVAVAASAFIPGAGPAVAAILKAVAGAAATSGMSTLLSGSGSNKPAGVSVSQVNEVGPWNVAYGRQRVGGTPIYIHEFGDSNKYLDIVFAVACHPCQSVDTLLFDNSMIQIDPSSNTSFTPVQQTVDIVSISRSNNIVTVQLSANIPLLTAGTDIYIQGVTGDHSMNGRFQVQTIVSQIVGVGTPGSVTFTYLSGGTTDTFTSQGQARTAWVDYGRKVYMETLLGNHTATFNGMLNGTPPDGDTLAFGAYVQDGSNPWTASMVGFGKTLVWLRFHFNDTYFAAGLPKVSFIVHGKNDILDVRSGATRYTENSALCIADYLSNTTWGYSYAYHTEIPDAPLIAAANICDEAVPLAAGGTEPRYTTNGQFNVNESRGTVLQGLLSACGGNLVESAGQVSIYPAAWRGSTPLVMPDINQMAGPLDFIVTPSIRELYNGVKGTFISQANRWVQTDFPPYAEDTDHGYVNPLGGTGYYDVNLTADGGARRWKDIQLRFTASVSTAQRLAKIELGRSRPLGKTTVKYNLAAFQVQPMDVVSLTFPFLNWSSQVFEVRATRFIAEKQPVGTGSETVALGVTLDLIQTNAGIFVWSTTEENTAQGYRQSDLPTNTFGTTPSPPANVGTPTIDSIGYDTQNVTILGHGPLPSILNGFSGAKLYYCINSAFDAPILIGDATWNGTDAVWSFTIVQPIPAANQSWTIFAVSYANDPASANTLVTTGIGASPHVAVSILSGIPGNITGISALAVDQATDPLTCVISGTATPPSPLNGFIGCEVYYQNITPGSTDVPHDTGQFPQYGGSGTYTFSFKIPAPVAAQTWRVWFVSANQAITEVLVTSGASESATQTVNVMARASSAVPPAPVVGAVTAVIVFNATGNRWGYNPITVQAPVGGWVAGMQIQVDSLGDLGASPVPVIPLFKVFVVVGSSTVGMPATATSPFVGVGGPTPPNFQRPAFGTTQNFQVSVTSLNSAGTPTATPVLSAIIPLSGGGVSTPAPGFGAITAVVTESGPYWSASVSAVVPPGNAFIAYFDMFIFGDIGSSAPQKGWVGRFQNSDIPLVGTFKFVIFQNPTPGIRPLTGTQTFNVQIVTYSGDAINTAAPTISGNFSVTSPATSGSGLAAGGLTVTPSVKYSQDGGVIQYLNVGWTEPTNTDISSIGLVWLDTSDAAVVNQVVIEQIGPATTAGPVYGYGTLRARKFAVTNTTATLQVVIYSINYAGVNVASNSVTVPITAAAGQLNAGRLVSLSSRLTNTGGTLDLAPNGITFGFIQSIDPSTIGLNGAHWTAAQIATVNASAILVGTLVAGMSITTPTINGGTILGSSLTISGTGFVVHVDPINGVLVSNTTNGSNASMLPGWLTVSQAATPANSAKFQYNGLQFFDAASNIAFNISAQPSGHFLSTSKAGSFVSLTGSGSFFNVVGTYKVNNVIVIAADGSITFPASQVVNGVAAFPANFAGKIILQLQGGGVIGYIPFIGVTS